MLSCNERAVEYLENHEHLIQEYDICMNINAIHIIEKRIKYYDEDNNHINYNKNAVNFLRNNPNYIDYSALLGQEHGIEFVDTLIKKNKLDKTIWYCLSMNPAAMHILNDPKYYKYIDWYAILYNKNAVELVKKNIHKVNKYWNVLCKQPHLIDIIEQNMDKIDWNSLSSNYNAIDILEKNMDKVLSYYVFGNKNGFQLLLRLNHVFNDYIDYHKNIVYDYFDYCEKNNIPFNLVEKLSEFGYTEKHMEFLKYNHYYPYLSANPNIFEYDYKRMRETRQSLLWYNDIKK